VKGPTELGALLDLLREKGVTEFSGFDITVKLGSFAAASEQPASTAAQADSVRAEFQKMIASKPRGKDGLTAEEQEDLYGTVIDPMPEGTD
jgi:hypothetical protein